MSKRMTSETIIFDTDWLTEADFEDNSVSIIIDFQAYDTLKVMVDIEDLHLEKGGIYQEFEVYKLENFPFDYRGILSGEEDDLILSAVRFDVGQNVSLDFHVMKGYWKNELRGYGSIYIKGVKR